MKMSKKLEPLLAGLFASIIIGLLSFLSFETSTGFWLMFSFGEAHLIVTSITPTDIAHRYTNNTPCSAPPAIGIQ